MEVTWFCFLTEHNFSVCDRFILHQENKGVGEMRFELAKSLFQHIEVHDNRKKLTFLWRRAGLYLEDLAVTWCPLLCCFCCLQSHFFIFVLCDPETVSLMLLLKICSGYNSYSPIFIVRVPQVLSPSWFFARLFPFLAGIWTYEAASQIWPSHALVQSSHQAVDCLYHFWEEGLLTCWCACSIFLGRVIVT